MDPLFIPIIFPYLEEDKENIKTTENRESLCTSAKSYEKKLQYLQSEKERIIKAYNDNNEAIEKLRKGSYLEKMVKEKKEKQLYVVDLEPLYKCLHLV